MTRTKQIRKKKEIFIPNEYTDDNGVVWIEKTRGSYVKKDIINNKLKEENNKLKEENNKLKEDYKHMISKCGAYAANMTKYKKKNNKLLDEIKNLKSYIINIRKMLNSELG